MSHLIFWTILVISTALYADTPSTENLLGVVISVITAAIFAPIVKEGIQS